jgi:hypothetical protein
LAFELIPGFALRASSQAAPMLFIGRNNRWPDGPAPIRLDPQLISNLPSGFTASEPEVNGMFLKGFEDVVLSPSEA